MSKLFCVLSWDGAHPALIATGLTPDQVAARFPEVRSGVVSLTRLDYTAHRHGEVVDVCPGCPRCAPDRPESRPYLRVPEMERLADKDFEA